VEKHIQTIVVAVCLALLLWAGTTIIDMRDRITRSEAVLTNVNATVQTLQVQLSSASDDRYRAADARRDFDVRDKKILELEGRITNLERDNYKHHQVGK
jgi:hypothetical protein